MVSRVLPPALPRIEISGLKPVKLTGSCGPVGVTQEACFLYNGKQAFLLCVAHHVARFLKSVCQTVVVEVNRRTQYRNTPSQSPECLGILCI